MVQIHSSVRQWQRVTSNNFFSFALFTLFLRTVNSFMIYLLQANSNTSGSYLPVVIQIIFAAGLEMSGQGKGGHGAAKPGSNDNSPEVFRFLHPGPFASQAAAAGQQYHARHALTRCSRNHLTEAGRCQKMQLSGFA